MAGAGLAAIVLTASLPPRGPILIEVLSPAPGATIAVRDVELLVRVREHAIAACPGQGGASRPASCCCACARRWISTGADLSR